MVKMTINITQDVLEESKNCVTQNQIGYQNQIDKVGQNCAIGKAIFDLFGDKSWVFGSYIAIWKEKVIYTINGYTTRYNFVIDLPKEAQSFIQTFDKLPPKLRVKMEPFSFDIEIPDEVIELLGGVEEVNEILKESKTMQVYELQDSI